MAGNRKIVIETAQRLMCRQGYRATGIREILRESRVSRSNFYYHFASKRQLIEEVIGAWNERLQQMLAAILERDLNYRQQIEMFVQTFIDAQAKDGFTVCPFGRLLLELGEEEPSLRKQINQVFEDLHREISRWIRLGIERGEFSSTTDADALARALLVAIQGGIIFSHAQGNARALAESCRFILERA